MWCTINKFFDKHNRLLYGQQLKNYKSRVIWWLYTLVGLNFGNMLFLPNRNYSLSSQTLFNPENNMSCCDFLLINEERLYSADSRTIRGQTETFWTCRSRSSYDVFLQATRQSVANAESFTCENPIWEECPEWVWIAFLEEGTFKLSQIYSRNNQN
jgi:hypothetical protein